MDEQLQEASNRARCVEALHKSCLPGTSCSEASYEEVRRNVVNKRVFISTPFHHIFRAALRTGFIVPGFFPGNYKTVECCIEDCTSPASEMSTLEPGERVCLVCKEIEDDQL